MPTQNFANYLKGINILVSTPDSYDQSARLRRGLCPDVEACDASDHIQTMTYFSFHTRFLQYAGNLLNRR